MNRDHAISPGTQQPSDSGPSDQEEPDSAGSYNGGGFDRDTAASLTNTWKLEPSIWKSKIHPLAEKVGHEIDTYFLGHWDFGDEKAKQNFLKAGFSRVTCYYFPEARGDRIAYACRLLTILFLIDGSLPAEYIMYDLWTEMRRVDTALANATIEPTFVFMQAQTDKSRLEITKLGDYFEYRERDVGKELLSSLMRFTMDLHMTTSELAPLATLERYCGRHISIVNDILSWEKEVRAASDGHREGSALCSAVKVLSDETGLGIAATKRVLWSMTREIERGYTEEVRRVLEVLKDVSEKVKAYIRGLEYQMSGNEEWSVTTQRYSEV
ncbi:MAG: hypothetical protein Q9160_001600 [Pyrenula sp. 1 TL-2023]